MKNVVITKKKKKHNKFLQGIRRDYLLYLMILPGILYVIIFKYIPMYGMTIAFKDYNITSSISDAVWVGFDNFIDLFRRNAFQRAFYNNIIISLSKLVFGFPMPIILALLINEIKRTKLKKIVQTSVILPNFISWIVIYGLMTAIFSPNTGVMSSIAHIFGYQGDIVNLLTNKDTFRELITISYIWQAAGIGTIVYLASISGIDTEQYEAAALDGAGRWRQMWHITLANLKPTIITLLIFRVGGIMNAGFDQIFAISNDIVISKADIISTYVYRLGLEQRKFSIATAAGFLESMIGLVLVLAMNKIAKTIDKDSAII
jgi:putative aldouronate transport system permease protein